MKLTRAVSLRHSTFTPRLPTRRSQRNYRFTTHVLSHTPPNHIDLRFTSADTSYYTVRSCRISINAAHLTISITGARRPTDQSHQSTLCVRRCNWPVSSDCATCMRWSALSQKLCTNARSSIRTRTGHCAVQTGQERIWGAKHFILKLAGGWSRTQQSTDVI